MKTLALKDIEELKKIANNKGCTVIFKHNTSCPISKRAITNFDNDLALLPEDTTVYVLDLLSYRDISDAIAENFDVKHESPQTLVIKDGKCVFNQSLYEISASDTAEAIRSN